MIIPRAETAAYALVLGHFGNKTTYLHMNGDARTLDFVGQLDSLENPGWIEPGEGNDYYVITEAQKAIGMTLGSIGNDSAISSVFDEQAIPGVGAVHGCYTDRGLAISNYGSGSVAWLPMANGSFCGTSAETNLTWAYADRTPPTPGQTQARAHGIVAKDDKFFVADLGSDAVWRFNTDNDTVNLEEQIRTPAGFGPRHLAVWDDNVFVIGEMGNAVMALPNTTTRGGRFAPVSILPANLPEGAGSLMGGGEIVAHPAGVLYASNRNIAKVVEKYPSYSAKGDTVTILSATLPPSVIAQIETSCDHIRAMSISPDGHYVAVAGLNNKRLEIYGVFGDYGEEWELMFTWNGIEQVTDIKFFPQ